MDLRIGKRKLIASGALMVVVAIAVAAWSTYGTDALIGVLIGSTLGGLLVVGWLTVQSERRLARLVTNTQKENSKTRRQIELLEGRLDARIREHANEVIGQIALDSREHAEALLKAMRSSIIRSEILQQELLDTQQRLLGLHRDASDLQTRLADEIGALSGRISGEAERTIGAVRSHAPSLKQLRWETKQLFRQLEALIALYEAIRPTAPLPPTRTWAAAPDLLRYLYESVRARRPNLILECGSGVSSLILGYAVKANGYGRVISVEHLADYQEKTLRWVSEHGLEPWVEVRLAPLADIDVDGEVWPWYSLDAIPDSGIDLVFVDGPPGATTKNARYPALPLLSNRLSPQSMVILDDAARDEEAAIAQRWSELFPEVEMSVIDHEKGTTVFIFQSGAR